MRWLLPVLSRAPFICLPQVGGVLYAVAMIKRYAVTRLPGDRRWVILDRRLSAPCALPDDQGQPVPLEWSAREAAEAWLYMCRVAWGRGLVQAPEGWN